VLDVRDGKALLITEDALVLKEYNDEEVDVTWEKCTLRDWLGGEFLDSLPASIKERVVQTTNKTPKNPKWETPGGKDTKDKVFLLSIAEAKKYFKNNDDRVTKVLGTDHYGDTSWWLRTAGMTQYMVGYVDGDGSIPTAGYVVDSKSFGVRPALWLTLG
jgi:hypothetical protein